MTGVGATSTVACVGVGVAELGTPGLLDAAGEALPSLAVIELRSVGAADRQADKLVGAVAQVGRAEFVQRHAIGDVIVVDDGVRLLDHHEVRVGSAEIPKHHGAPPERNVSGELGARERRSKRLEHLPYDERDLRNAACSSWRRLPVEERRMGNKRLVSGENQRRQVLQECLHRRRMRRAEREERCSP